MRTVTSLGGLPVVTLASTMDALCSFSEMEDLAPSRLLKIIPRADGPGPAIKQLIDGATARQNSDVHVFYEGKGTVKFSPNPLCDLSPLTPKACLGAYYAEVSFAEDYAKIVHDYLAGN